MQAPRPNILLITTDQQRFDTIAALENADIHTPHLDWLVDEGITFTRAYSDCPICVPARTTLMTGMRAPSLGMSGNSGMAEAMAGRQTLPGLLTDAGYQTRAQGKMHFGPMRCNYGFEHMELPMDYYRARQRLGGERQPKRHGVCENEMAPVISTVHETESLTHWTVERSIDFLETRDDTRPFFLWTSFAKPHPPFDPCANYWALYANRQLAPPVRGDWSRDVDSLPTGFMGPTYCLNSAHRLSDAMLAETKRAYYACITQIDYSLGLLFARLRELQLLQNTWIIFTSDHGEMLGDHHMGAKVVFFEGAAHVPLIIRRPRASGMPDPDAGRQNRTLAQLADVMPTLLKIAKVRAPDPLDGVDLLELGGEDRPFFGACGGKQFAVIRDNIKYCYAREGAQELLFDLNDDAMETRDLIRDARYAERLTQLRAELAANVARHLPQCMTGDGRIEALPPIPDARRTPRWPGFISTTEPSDVLH